MLAGVFDLNWQVVLGCFLSCFCGSVGEEWLTILGLFMVSYFFWVLCLGSFVSSAFWVDSCVVMIWALDF